MFTKLFNLKSFRCIAIVKFSVDGALTHLFLTGSLWQVAMHSSRRPAGPPDLCSALPSLGLEGHSPLLCQHEAASTTQTETHHISFGVFYFFSDKTRNLYFQVPLKSILHVDRNLKIPNTVLTPQPCQALV